MKAYLGPQCTADTRNTACPSNNIIPLFLSYDVLTAMQVFGIHPTLNRRILHSGAVGRLFHLLLTSRKSSGLRVGIYPR